MLATVSHSFHESFIFSQSALPPLLCSIYLHCSLLGTHVPCLMLVLQAPTLSWGFSVALQVCFQGFLSKSLSSSPRCASFFFLRLLLPQVVHLFCGDVRSITVGLLVSTFCFFSINLTKPLPVSLLWISHKAASTDARSVCFSLQEQILFAFFPLIFSWNSSRWAVSLYTVQWTWG